MFRLRSINVQRGTARTLGLAGVVAIAGVLALTGCDSHGYSDNKATKSEKNTASHTPSSGGSSSGSAEDGSSHAPGCPSNAEITKAIGGDNSVKLQGEPLCVGDWIAAIVTAPDTDPANVVLRKQSNGELKVVVLGTADLCHNSELQSQAPSEIRSAAGCS